MATVQNEMEEKTYTQEFELAIKHEIDFLRSLGFQIDSVILMGANYEAMIINFKGVFVVLGMMLVGLGLSDVTSLKIYLRFVGLSFVAKFLLWPILILGFIFIDQNLLHQFTNEVHNTFLLLSVVPIAANSVAYATTLKNNPDKVAISVFFEYTIFLDIYPNFCRFVY